MPLQNLLHGSVLGHPLHALITDVPIGAWTVTAALDTVELVGGPAIDGADAALAIGLTGALGAAATGWADWSDTSGETRTLGMAHALTNGIGTSAYVIALYLRRSGRRRPGIIVALGAYGVIAAAAYLGGELSFGQLLGAKHTGLPVVPPAEFTPVLSADALPPTAAVRAELAGIPLLLSRTADGVAAISAVCTHRGAPLDEGEFDAGCVRCPWHGSRFALADGRVIDGPATFPQARFEARINAGQIEVRALTV